MNEKYVVELLSNEYYLGTDIPPLRLPELPLEIFAVREFHKVFHGVGVDVSDGASITSRFCADRDRPDENEGYDVTVRRLLSARGKGFDVSLVVEDYYQGLETLDELRDRRVPKCVLGVDGRGAIADVELVFSNLLEGVSLSYVFEKGRVLMELPIAEDVRQQEKVLNRYLMIAFPYRPFGKIDSVDILKASSRTLEGNYLFLVNSIPEDFIGSFFEALSTSYKDVVAVSNAHAQAALDARERESEEFQA